METVKMAPVLSGEECARISALVHGLRRLWKPWRPELTLHTLGVNAHRDAHERSLQIYSAMARVFNPVLRREFGWMYDRVLDALHRELKARVAYHPDYALPGFHILLPYEQELSPREHSHHDGQFRFLDWGPGVDLDRADTLSFTLPVSLPAAGAGLEVWDLHESEVPGFSPEATGRILDTRPCRGYTYRLGFVAWHSGQYFHRIEPRPQESGEVRMTLQGHGVRVGDTWQLFW